MTRFLIWACALAVSTLAAEPDLTQVLHGVEQRYNRVKTLQVQFQQQYSPGKAVRNESGELYLRKPGKMRWEYTKPAGKLFVGDGKFLYLYTPQNNRVEKTPFKETEDMRAPLAFLLGKLDFDRDFGRYVWRRQGQDWWITAQPRSDKMPFTHIEFLVTPEYIVKQVSVTGQDRSVMQFQFNNEKMNPPLAESLFQFKAPAGAEVIETSAQ